MRLFEKIDKFLSENTYVDNSGKTFWGAQGAGVLPIAEDTGRLLIAHRSPYVNEPNTYGVWGGAIDPGEDPKEAARRELSEEAAYRGKIKLVPAFVYTSPGGDFKYHNFIGLVESEFEPRLDWETQDYEWLTFSELLDLRNRLHFGLKALIDNSTSKILQYAKRGDDRLDESDEADRRNRVKWAQDEPENLLPNIHQRVPDRYVSRIPQYGQKTVTIWRAAPEGATSIRPGDWVALEESYARDHQNMDRLRILRARVPSEHVAWAGTDMNEWFYVGDREVRATVSESSDVLGEMAAVKKSHRDNVYYHGTSKTSAARGILRSGINPPDLSDRSGALRPRDGKVYLTESIKYAIIYALGADMAGSEMPDRWIGDDPFGYVFVVPGTELEDIEPDEDSVGYLLSAQLSGRTSRFDYLEDIAEYVIRRKDLAYEYPEEFEDYYGDVLATVKAGYIDALAIVGKEIIPHLEDWMIYDMIQHAGDYLSNGLHIANTGSVEPSECWRIDKRRSKELKKDGSNFFKIAERVRNRLPAMSESVEDGKMLKTFHRLYGSDKAVMWVLDVPRNDSFSWSERVVLDRLDSEQIDKCRKNLKMVRAAVVSSRDVDSHWTAREKGYRVVLTRNAKPRELTIEEVDLALSAVEADRPLSSLESSRSIR